MIQPESDILSNPSADDHKQYFTAKIGQIRDSTAAAPPAVIEYRAVPEPLSDFMPTTAEEVTTIIRKSPAKQCQLDPVPTWLIKKADDVFANVITSMCGFTPADEITGTLQEGDCSSAVEKTVSGS
jgi:hypothetical protein